MPLLTITTTDLKSAGLNILVGTAHKVIGGTVAYLVILAATRAFSIYGDKSSQRLGRCTILVSALVSYYLASQTALKTWTFRKAVELYVLELLFNQCCHWWVSKKIEVFVPSLLGTVGGNLGGAWLGYLSGHVGGRTSLVLMGIMGAQSAFSISRENAHRHFADGPNPESFADRFLGSDYVRPNARRS